MNQGCAVDRSAGEARVHPLGSYWIDNELLLNGGIPCGMLTEIFSEEDGEGKTLVLTRIIANAQRMLSGIVVYIDVETGTTRPGPSV